MAREISEYPMRINKYLAHQGIATRKAADELIARGKVTINGRTAVLGDKVGDADLVEIRGNRASKHYQYFAYNKPVGVITHSPQHGEKDARGDARIGDFFPVGRLDKDSSGLLILTNDGRITDRLLHPKYEHDKEYEVETELPIREGFKKAMEGGIDIGGYRTQPCTVRKTGPTTFRITLSEGKKHQIRRMVDALHNQVVSLKRVRVLNVRLDDLAPGDARPIMGEELTLFLSKLGLS